MRLHLHLNHFEHAYNTLERTKSLNWLGYLSNRNQLRWSAKETQSQTLVELLNELRAEHQWYYRLAFEEISEEDQKGQHIDSATARQELYIREHRMRAITEQLYLQADNTIYVHVTPPHLQEIQAALEPSTLLIEYYCDAQNIYVFCINATNLYLHRLPITLPELQQNIRQLQLNIASALKTGASASATANLALIGKRILQKLYACVLNAQNITLAEYRRIVIVPSGVLHYLPFHLLHNGTQYLIESHEVTLLPAAGLLLRQPLRRPAGALALAHSWEERLPNTLQEARLVNELFGGEAISEQSATRNSFASAPVQVLHIAAHGEHRLDQPDLSYFQLADGQVYTDDLFQNDLSYELVTLSACETGRAYVTAGDELIGLGRGFLYAGAASLITSLWRVDDGITLTFMEHLYRSLQSGASKAEAIRNAQCAIIQAQPQLHPAFWGAFQLIGHAGPLSRPE
ncbi:hypothetical protein SE17_06635 [Kouleothrix aurantiaca]|uniref:CHAT domain-containing protein n=1 Tax=Kouleothrix aurantiaca TaxID=186479 RepID=A0A0P9D4D8_9CHLR|nr:hypothetical protein SE17_06635 [Kouleothrix aurantiaca]